MNGIDVRIRPIDLILKHCRVHSVQFSFGSIRCCINITNENPCGGTFLVFKELSEADAEMAFRGEIQLTLLSERRGNVGTGVSCNTVALDSNVHSLQPASAGLTDTFTLLSGAESEISIVYETEGKPNIELGKFLVSIRLYALALVKDCPHKCASPRTEKERYSASTVQTTFHILLDI